MTSALGIFTFIVLLATLILVHELGHFTFAKLMGVRVEEFALGFPPRVKSWRRGGTVYSINAIPIGGFVKMLGENGNQSEPDSFGAQPPWQRLIILIAGPSMNILLALTIFFFVYLGGSPRNLPVVTQVAPSSPAVQAGLKAGDRIVAVDGQTVKYADQLESATTSKLGQRIRLSVERGRGGITLFLTPRKNPPPHQGPIGIVLDSTTTVRYGPARAAHQALSALGDMVASIPLVIQSVSQHGGQQVTGPIGIAHVTTDVVRSEPQQGLGSIFLFVAFLSANLGVLNLLPIPALDGGRVVFVLISWIRRRNLDPEVEGVIHLVGMAVLLFLITLVSYQDIMRWVSGKPF